MTQLHSFPALSRNRALLALSTVLALGLALSGCADSAPKEPQQPAGADSSETGPEQDPQPNPPAGAKGTATVTLPHRSLSFSLTTCIVDDKDVLMEGPGSDDASGEIAFFSIDLYENFPMPEGGARIEFGIDGPFQHSPKDEYVTAPLFDGHVQSYGQAGSEIRLVTQFLGNGGQPDGIGTIEASCD